MKTSRLEHLVISNTNVIFLFGTPGAGKTTLIGAIYDYLINSDNLVVSLNSNDNPVGVHYINEIHEQMEMYNKFPAKTEVSENMKEIDWCIKDINDYQNLNNQSIFTFLDTAGENLQTIYTLFNKENINSNNTNTGGKIKNEILEYLLEQLHLTILMIVSYDELLHLKFQHKVLSAFLNYLSQNTESPNNIGIVVTKWDLNQNKSQTVDEFLWTNFKDSMKKIKLLDINFKSFGCTVGSVDLSSPPPYKIVNYSVDSYRELVEWLVKIGKTKKTKNRIARNPEEVVDSNSSFKEFVNFFKI